MNVVLYNYGNKGRLYIHSTGNYKYRLDKWLLRLKLADTKVYDNIQFMNLNKEYRNVKET